MKIMRWIGWIIFALGFFLGFLLVTGLGIYSQNANPAEVWSRICAFLIAGGILILVSKLEEIKK